MRRDIRLLLIESNNQVAAAVTALLHDRGIQVEVIDDPNRAAAAVERYAPDVVIFDLPPNNGRQELQKIRSRWPELPIIIVSGDRPDVQPLLQGNRTEFLAKPFDGDTVMRAIHRLIQSR